MNDKFETLYIDYILRQVESGYSGFGYGELSTQATKILITTKILYY